MPLTLFLAVAGVILWLYVRRANLGIDQHPGEKVAIVPRKGPSVTLQPRQGPISILPPQGGYLSPGGT
jgi:hypothetical protein